MIELIYIQIIYRKQAINTGNRLKSLNIKFDRIVHSTMTRAKETAELIKESLDDVSCESCSLLREGAPCPPEPSSSSNWKPERWVRIFECDYFCHFSEVYSHSCFIHRTL